MIVENEVLEPVTLDVTVLSQSLHVTVKISGKAEAGAGRQYFMSLNEKLMSFFPSSQPPITVISAIA